MRDHDGAERTAGRGSPRADLTVAMWASLVPLMLLLHPYAGLVQDARIYIGRGVADHDPAGVGRDVMFVNDGQTSFSIMRRVVSMSLSVMGPEASAMALAFVGAIAWLVAAVAVARTLTGGRSAWAAVACMVALPTFYGAYRVFDYAEVVATPRVFAEAAVLGGLAALMAGRRGAAAALLGLAVAFHPLIALPGLAVGATLLVVGDRRWLVACIVVVLAILAGALLHVPVLTRLVQPMDDVWLALLRQRSTYLFPTLWPASAFGPILCQATAAIVASTMAPPPVRRLLLATVGVVASALAASWLFGDLHASTLIVQLQLWRALWLLAALGNAAFALAATALWRRGSDACVALAPLMLAWMWSDNLAIVIPLVSLTLGWLAAVSWQLVPAVSPLALRVLAGLVFLVACMTTFDAAWFGLVLLRSALAQGGRMNWPLVVGLQIQTAPLVASILALALVSIGRLSVPVRYGMISVVAFGCVVAVWGWDGRTPERRSIEHTGLDPALRAAIGPLPGDVMWVDEDSENWFLAGRPAFFNSIQGAPILFSRPLAIDWADRAAFARELGLARETAVSPWGTTERRLDPIVLRAADLEAFCRNPRHPAAVVAPGDQRGAAPPGWTVALWRPAEPFRRMWIDAGAIRWTAWDAFTVVRCPAPRGEMPDSGTRDR